MGQQCPQEKTVAGLLRASDNNPQRVLHREKSGLRIEVRVDFPAFPIALPQVFKLVPLRT